MPAPLHRLAFVSLILLWTAGPVAAGQDDPRLDMLFDRLHATQDEAEAHVIQSFIWSIWLEAHDDELNRLMASGTRAMQVGDFEDAIGDFTRIIEIAPGFAEGWNKRATVYYMTGRFDESLADCKVVIALEPRHFGALSGLGLIHTAKGDNVSALEWFRKALEQNPHMPSVAQRVEDLSRSLEGEPI